MLHTIHFSVCMCINVCVYMHVEVWAFHFMGSLAPELKGDKNVVKRIVCVAERLSITAQCKISFTQLLHKKLDLVHGLNTFQSCMLSRLQGVVVFLQGTSDFCVSPDKFIVNQTKDFLSAGNLSLQIPNAQIPALCQ